MNYLCTTYQHKCLISKMTSKKNSSNNAFQNEDGTSPLPARSRKRRRQDTLIPDDCPLTRDQIVDLPIDEFNELIERQDFTEAFKAQCRDWRRKGKNRVSHFILLLNIKWEIQKQLMNFLFDLSQSLPHTTLSFFSHSLPFVSFLCSKQCIFSY